MKGSAAEMAEVSAAEFGSFSLVLFFSGKAQRENVLGLFALFWDETFAELS